MAAKLSFIKADKNSAKIHCIASGYSLPDDDVKESNTTITYYIYSNLIYSWSFNFSGSAYGRDTDADITGLEIGNVNNVTGTVYVTYDETIRIDAKTDDGIIQGTPHTTTKSFNSSSDTINIYTHPDNFFWDIEPNRDVLIYKSLTASKWNELAKQSAQYKSWIKQTDYLDNWTEVHSNDLITADIYNEVANNLEQPLVKKGDVIYANLFIALSTKLNSE